MYDGSVDENFIAAAVRVAWEVWPSEHQVAERERTLERDLSCRFRFVGELVFAGYEASSPHAMIHVLRTMLANGRLKPR